METTDELDMSALVETVAAAMVEDMSQATGGPCWAVLGAAQRDLAREHVLPVVTQTIKALAAQGYTKREPGDWP